MKNQQSHDRGRVGERDGGGVVIGPRRGTSSRCLCQRATQRCVACGDAIWKLRAKMRSAHGSRDGTREDVSGGMARAEGKCQSHLHCKFLIEIESTPRGPNFLGGASGHHTTPVTSVPVVRQPSWTDCPPEKMSLLQQTHNADAKIFCSNSWLMSQPYHIITIPS